MSNAEANNGNYAFTYFGSAYPGYNTAYAAHNPAITGYNNVYPSYAIAYSSPYAYGPITNSAISVDARQSTNDAELATKAARAEQLALQANGLYAQIYHPAADTRSVSPQQPQYVVQSQDAAKAARAQQLALQARGLFAQVGAKGTRHEREQVIFRLTFQRFFFKTRHGENKPSILTKNLLKLTA